MCFGVDEDRGAMHVSGIVRHHDVHDVVTPERGVARLSVDAGTFLFEPVGQVDGSLLEGGRGLERTRREPGQDDAGLHGHRSS